MFQRWIWEEGPGYDDDTIASTMEMEVGIVYRSQSEKNPFAGGKLATRDRTQNAGARNPLITSLCGKEQKTLKRKLVKADGVGLAGLSFPANLDTHTHVARHGLLPPTGILKPFS